MQGLVKGAILCFRNPYLYFWHGESTSTASQLTSPVRQKSKDLNKVYVIEGFLKIDTLCFELSHSIESSLNLEVCLSVCQCSRLLTDNSKLKSDDYTLWQLYKNTLQVNETGLT